MSAALLLALIGRGAVAQEPSLTIRSSRIMLPLVSAEMCDAGEVAADRSRGSYAMQLDVHANGSSRGWILTIRAEQSSLQPEAAGRTFPDLRWKLDQENEGQYKRLDDHEMVVLENPAGGDARVAIDLAASVGWDLDPGSYSLGIIFQIVSL
jgi:hypothetical protein